MKKNRVFVVMPSVRFSGSAEKLRIITETVNMEAWDAYLPDYDHRAPSFDLTISQQAMRTSAFVFADLTHERPSCYFEVGIAESCGAALVTAAAKGTDIHQMSRPSNTKFFASLDEFRDIFCQALKSHSTWRD